MRDDYLFSKHEIRPLIDHQRSRMLSELDSMPDGRLLNTDLSELEDYFFEKYRIDLPVLGEPQVDQGRTKMTVGRYGGFDYEYEGGAVQVDAQYYTLEVPFTGDAQLFFTRGNTWSTSPPVGTVAGDVLTTTLTDRDPSTDQVNQHFERFLRQVNENLGWLKGDVDAWNEGLKEAVRAHVSTRRERSDRANSVSSGLKFAMKNRGDAAATFSAPVTRKRIAPTLPPPTPGAAPEPVLTNEAYRDVLNTLQQMSEVMERSPHAYAELDEEALRFQFLVPLNARFEGEARGEVFNYGGKSDILITYRGRNIFIAECKIWKGAKALSEAIDQLLGYLSWRDTKAALLVFNRNKNFSSVLEQIDPTVRQHPNFVSADGQSGATEFRYTLSHKDDPKRNLRLTVLAFDIPAPDAA